MTSPICPRCGGQDFHEREQHHYRDSEELSEENKSIYTRKLSFLKCRFEFDPSTEKCVL